MRLLGETGLAVLTAEEWAAIWDVLVAAGYRPDAHAGQRRRRQPWRHPSAWESASLHTPDGCRCVTDFVDGTRYLEASVLRDCLQVPGAAECYGTCQDLQPARPRTGGG